MVRAKESRSVMLQPQALDGSAMVTTSVNNWHWGPCPNQKQANQRQLATEEGRANSFRSQNRDDKDNLWCSYCEKSRHEREYCWKLIGKPPSKEWGYKGGQSTNRGQSSNEGQAYLTSTQLNLEAKSEIGEFNKEEVEKLRSLLGTLEKQSGTCSLVHSGMLLTSHGLNVSDTPFSNSWIIDSGVTDQMTNLSQNFSTYTPCPSNKKIATADGSLTLVAGLEDIQLNSFLTLKNVLHVPKLSINLFICN